MLPPPSLVKFLQEKTPPDFTGLFLVKYMRNLQNFCRIVVKKSILHAYISNFYEFSSYCI